MRGLLQLNIYVHMCSPLGECRICPTRLCESPLAHKNMVTTPATKMTPPILPPTIIPMGVACSASSVATTSVLVPVPAGSLVGNRKVRTGVGVPSIVEVGNRMFEVVAMASCVGVGVLEGTGIDDELDEALPRHPHFISSKSASKRVKVWPDASRPARSRD